MRETDTPHPGTVWQDHRNPCLLYDLIPICTNVVLRTAFSLFAKFSVSDAL